MGKAATPRYPITLQCTGHAVSMIHTAGQFLADHVDRRDVVALLNKLIDEHCDDDVGKALSAMMSMAIAVMDSTDASTRAELKRIDLIHGGLVVKIELTDDESVAKMTDEHGHVDLRIRANEGVRQKLDGSRSGYFRGTMVPGVGFCILEPVEGQSW